MNIDRDLPRKPLGKALMKLDNLDRQVLRRKLLRMGLTQGKWKYLLTEAVAHKQPGFVQDAIIEDVPSTKELFKPPGLKPEPV